MKAVPSRRLCAWALLALSVSCASSRGQADAAGSQNASVEAPGGAAPSQGEYTLAEDVSVRRLAPGVWLHTTLGSGDYKHIPANGLIIEDGDGSLLVDTTWNAQQAERLLVWAEEELHRPVRAAVVTHFHSDRTGGVPALTARGLPVYGLAETARLAAASKEPVPTRTFEGGQTLGSTEFFFPGAGHARDNIVVWHPSSGVLFGGCFVKAGDAKDLGNLSDADTAAWPASVARVQERFPQARIIVPGHGLPGGPGLLTHTQELLRASPSTQ
ncbi:subclass B1 metallo-beta-lactamase [Hyalangium versicolor]|uniref:subclass B1 metallo-beta-lactamase n=1 Tax=Hyalangium versicolor TaxID=2861190 RepID=UPI001CCA5DBB|nr:subclass B1 metallo-beta-lactamase [Hyalangium versicolor]